MFVRIDKDLSVNINNIFSYKLSEDEDSFKLQVWSTQGVLIHNVIYLKSRPDQVKILIDFNNIMRDLTANPEVIRDFVDDTPEFVEDVEDNKHIQEKLDI